MIIKPSTISEAIKLNYLHYGSFHFQLLKRAYSKWPDIVKMNSTKAGALITVLRHIFARTGLPYVVEQQFMKNIKNKEKFYDLLISFLHEKSL